MALTNEEIERRRILSRLLVSLLRPAVRPAGAATQRLVTYCVCVSTFGPHRLGLNKLAEACGLARSTVRNTLSELCRKGWVQKLPDKTYVFTEQFINEPFIAASVEEKYKLIMEAAQQLGRVWPVNGVQNGPQADRRDSV